MKQRKPSDYVLMVFYILCMIVAILLLYFSEAKASDGIHMRRFYDAEAGIVCYTVYDNVAGLSTSCVQVNECQLKENPKFFALK